VWRVPLSLPAMVDVDRHGDRAMVAAGPQQQTRRRGVRRPNDGTDGQTDGRTLDSCTDTVRALSVNKLSDIVA